MEFSNAAARSDCHSNDKNATETITILSQKIIISGLHYSELNQEPTMSVLPCQLNQSTTKASTALKSDSQQQHPILLYLNNKSAIRQNINLKIGQDHYLKDEDLTTLVNSALMAHNVTRRRATAGVPDLFIYYHSPLLLIITRNEKSSQKQQHQLWILLYEMNTDPSLDLQQVFKSFFRRFASSPSDNHNITVSTHEASRLTNTSVDPITTKDLNYKHLVNNDHHHHCVSSTNDELSPAGFIYAPTTAAGGLRIKAHDTITNQVHLPHEISSLSLSLSSSRKNTTDNFNNSRRGSKDSCNSFNSSGLTVDNIIDRLLRPEVGQDDQIIPIFIIFFRKFMNPHELTTTLIKRFEDDLWMPTLPSSQQQRIVYILTTWTTDYWGDFYHDQTREQLDLFIGRLSDFMITTGSSSMQSTIEKLQPILTQPAPFDDPDDIWGRKYIDNDIQDFRNYNKKKDSGYISSYSGISPDSPTDDGFRLDDTIWSRHPYTSPPQVCMGSDLVARSIKHSGTAKSSLDASHTRSIPYLNNNRPIHDITTSGTAPESTPATTCNKAYPKFAGGLICLDTWKSPLYPHWNRQHNTKPCPPLPSPVTRTFYSTSFLSAVFSIPTPRPSTPNVHSTRIAHPHIKTTTHQIFSTAKNQYSLASVKLNTSILLSLSDQVLAQQLTWIEVELFGKIKSREFVRMIWNSHDHNQQQNHISPALATKNGLMASISHFNFVSAWVTSMIVTQPKLGKRVALLERFMMIGVALRDLNNYNTLMAILAGISNAAILRLKQTQEGIKKKKIYKRYQSLEKLMSSDRSHCSYRLALKASSGHPCIPYLGIHSQDLIALAEANKDVKTDGAIHWEKFRLMGECIMAIIKKQHQQSDYGLTPNPRVLTWIAQSQLLTDEEQYQQSIRVEPRLGATSMTRLRDRCSRI